MGRINKLFSVKFAILLILSCAIAGGCATDPDLAQNPADAEYPFGHVIKAPDRSVIPLPDEIKDVDFTKMERFFLEEIGLSSTGEIILYGTYYDERVPDFAKPGDIVFHLIQKDLFGTRLFWSYLVNCNNGRYLCLYNCQEGIDRHRLGYWNKPAGTEHEIELPPLTDREGPDIEEEQHEE